MSAGLITAAVFTLATPETVAQAAPADAGGRAVRPADELFWTPTLEQAIEMATANRVPIFVMGYSLVGDRSTYTKFGADCASTVF